MWQTKESHLETRFGAGDHGPLFKRSAAKTRHVRSLAVLWAEDLVGAQCRCPAEVEEVMRDCVDADAEDRPTMKEVVARLQGIPY